MTTLNTHRALVPALLAALLPALLAGCAPHADAPQTPAGVQVGQPMTQAQLQAVYQRKAAHKAVSAP